MDVNAEYRTLVGDFTFGCRNFTFALAFSFTVEELMEANVGRGILLWLLGVPIPVIILLWLFFGR
jgi:hypothetical protein